MNMLTRIQPDAGTPSDNPTREEAEAAFRTIIRWAGDDPDRDGLAETPARLARAFKEHFFGYALDPAQMLSTTFEETDGYDEMIVLRGIPFESHCEHHVAPIIGRAMSARRPNGRRAGTSPKAPTPDIAALFTFVLRPSEGPVTFGILINVHSIKYYTYRYRNRSVVEPNFQPNSMLTIAYPIGQPRQ
jgi:hypothetical protein